MNELKAAPAILPLLRPYPWALPVIITLGTLSALSEGFGMSLIIPLLQALGSNQSAHTNYYVGFLDRLLAPVQPENRLLLIPVVIFALVVAKNGLAYVNTTLLSWLTFDVGHRLRSSVFNQLLSVSYGFLEASQSGKLMNTLANETGGAAQALGVFINLLITCCTILVFVVLLLLMSWPTTLIAAVAVLLISTVIQGMTRRIARLGKEAVKANGRLVENILEGLAGMRVIRAFGREAYEEKRFALASEGIRSTFVKMDLLSNTVKPVSEMCYAGLFLIILAFTFQQRASVPMLFAFVFFLYRLQPHLKYLAAYRAELLRLTSSVEDVTSLLERADKPYTPSGRVPFGGLTGDITFESVTFAYSPAGGPALRNVTIRIPKGKTTAIVGPSGAGKSTLIKLLFRFYDADAGEVRVDGIPLRDLDLASWRERIAFAGHDSHLFTGTVQENIAYGRLGACVAEIAAAAEQANAHSFISDLPEGYGTVVGDHGIRLSAGQRQRIVLARAFLRDPEILILDEGTNALDGISEQRVLEALHHGSNSRTVIIVAHRLSTIEQADHIIVFDHGRVAEQGSFEELISMNGLFARLYRLQRAERSDGPAYPTRRD